MHRAHIVAWLLGNGSWRWLIKVLIGIPKWIHQRQGFTLLALLEGAGRKGRGGGRGMVEEGGGMCQMFIDWSKQRLICAAMGVLILRYSNSSTL